MNITFKGSPNKDSNRKTTDRVVIHWFGSGTLESADARFQNPASQVSAHYGISNYKVWQWVKENDVAYHAGNYPMNQRSIGIEHDATTTKNATETTYKTSGRLVADICKRYGIPIDREHIIKHSEVVPTQCCGTLDIDKIIDLAKGADGSGCEKQLKDMEANKDEWKAEARELRVEVKEKDAHIARAIELANDMESRLNDARADVVKTQAELNSYKALYEKQLDETIPELKAEIDKKNEKIRELKAQEYSAFDLIQMFLELITKRFNPRGGVDNG